MDKTILTDFYSALAIVEKLIDHETPILDRKLPRAKKGGAGLKTGLPQNLWFQSVFYMNEINAVTGLHDRVLSDAQIMYNWNEEFGKGKRDTKKNIGNGIKSGIFSIGTFRSRYRKAKLYPRQLKPFMISLRYTNETLPIKDGKNKIHYMTLEHIRELCLSVKIADPRFFTAKEIMDIKTIAIQRQELKEWGIPSPAQYQELDRSIPGGVYGKYKLFQKNQYQTKRTSSKPKGVQ